jgi:hypothetical protein
MNWRFRILLRWCRRLNGPEAFHVLHAIAVQHDETAACSGDIGVFGTLDRVALTRKSRRGQRLR